jgi:pilus assembly protein Flp/PilA
MVQIVDEERGATAIEYGLVAALLSIAVIGSLTNVADAMNGMWDFVSTSIDTAIE